MKLVKDRQNTTDKEDYNELLNNWKVEYDEIDLTGEYGTTHIYLAGDSRNAPILLLHGRNSSAETEWALNIEELSGSFYCIAADLFGENGKSIYKNKNIRLFDSNKWIDSILMELNIEQCSIIGVDSGAVIALTYGIYNPKVNRIICVDRAVKPIGQLFRNAKRIMSRERKFIRRYSLDEYDIDGIRCIKDKLYFIFGGMSLDSKLDKINFIIKDDFKYTIIDNTGENVILEQPAIVNEEIIKFLT